MLGRYHYDSSSRSVGRLEVIKETRREKEVHLRIPRYFRLLDTFRVSAYFYFRCTRWNLRIHSDNSHINLSFQGEEATRNPYSVMCAFGVKKADGSIVDICTCKHSLSGRNVSVGVLEFLDRSLLRERQTEFVISGCLIVTCRIRHLDMKLEGVKMLSDNIRVLFSDGEFCDTTLKVKDKELKAHKVILAARSPVFAAMFRHDMQEKQTGIINIPDCDPCAFQHFLEYLYSGKMENISTTNAVHLYNIADKYNVEELKDFCYEYFVDMLNVEDFCDTVITIAECNGKDFVPVIRVFFGRNVERISQTPEWKRLFGSNLADNFCVRSSLES